MLEKKRFIVVTVIIGYIAFVVVAALFVLCSRLLCQGAYLAYDASASGIPWNRPLEEYPWDRKTWLQTALAWIALAAFLIIGGQFLDFWTLKSFFFGGVFPAVRGISLVAIIPCCLVSLVYGMVIGSDLDGKRASFMQSIPSLLLVCCIPLVPFSLIEGLGYLEQIVK